MLTRFKTFGPYVLAAAIGGALALYPLGKNKTERALSSNAPLPRASSITAAPISVPQKTTSTGRVQTQNDNDRPDAASICDNDCQSDISKSLFKGGLLSEEMIARLLKNPSAFAKNLSNAPEIIAPLVATLKADEEKDNGTQTAALAILGALSDQDKFTLAKTLTAHAYDKNRLVGLELIELSSETQTDFIPSLNKILENEGSPAVLSKAINMASNLPKETELKDTMKALTKIIRHNESDHFSGTALLAKVNLAPSAGAVHADISASLASFSSDKNASGLEALDAVLRRGDTEFELGEGWHDDSSLRESVRVIAQNQELSERTRSQANQLLNSYFSDE